MGRIRRWLVPDTPRRRAWQAVAYLIVTALALTAAGIKYAMTSYPSRSPATVSTTLPGGGEKFPGTKPPRQPATGAPHTAPAVIRPASHRASPRPPHTAVTPSVTPAVTAPQASVTASATPLPTVPAPSSETPSAPPSAPSGTSSPPVTPPADTATPTPGADTTGPGTGTLRLRP